MTYRTLGLLIALAIGLLSAPLTSDAQTPPKIPRLGILEDSSHWGAFRQGLRDLGYVEGQNMAMECR
jgi:putative ABC transport system substrate-binding protein